jgi:molybdopterin converting factor subunit 1
MRIHVKYFAPFREKTGKKEEFLEGNFRTVQELMQYLHRIYGIETDFLMVAVNRAVVSQERELTEEDEVAVFPPVSGG